MNKRDALLSMLNDSSPPAYIPAGFFIHFDKSYHHGQAAIDKHLGFFHHTGMDFVKIQYENTFPRRQEIKTAVDWVKMPLYKRDFYEDQLNIIGGLMKAVGSKVPVIVTVYSPFMCAGHTIGNQEINEQIKENPDAVKEGMEIITESLMIFVKACIALGVDGFYASTQGNESHRFEDANLFNECIRPYDLTIMEEMDRSCDFNILHICDYHDDYDNLNPFLEYPGHVVNCSQKLGVKTLSLKEIADFFSRPYMGGVDRKGVIASGTEPEIEEMVKGLIEQAPEHFILGADCTLPGDINWDNIKKAISVAHGEGD
jgi:uroporphyrinogen decarboxylase